MKWLKNPWVILGGAVAAYFVFFRGSTAQAAEHKIAAENAKSQASGLQPINPEVVMRATQEQLDALRALQMDTLTPEQSRLLTEEMVLASGVNPPSVEGGVMSEWRPGVAPRPGTMPR